MESISSRTECVKEDSHDLVEILYKEASSHKEIKCYLGATCKFPIPLSITLYQKKASPDKSVFRVIEKHSRLSEKIELWSLKFQSQSHPKPWKLEKNPDKGAFQI